MQSSSSRCVPLRPQHFIPRNRPFWPRTGLSQEVLGFLEPRSLGLQGFCYLFKASCVIFAKVFRHGDIYSPESLQRKTTCSAIVTTARSESRQPRGMPRRWCPGGACRAIAPKCRKRGAVAESGAGSRSDWWESGTPGLWDYSTLLAELIISLLFKQMDTTCYWHVISNELF